MNRKGLAIGLCVLLLSGCGSLRKPDPKPDQTQRVMVEDLSTVLQDLDGFQSSQDDIEDDLLLNN